MNFSNSQGSLPLDFLEVALWNLTNPGRPQKLAPPLTLSDGGEVTSVAFSPDGRTLAAGDEGGTSLAALGEVGLWDLTNLRHPQKLGRPLTASDDGRVSSVAFSPDGRTLAAGDYVGNVNGGGVTLWNVTSPGRPQKLGSLLTSTGDHSGVASVAFSPDGQSLAADNGGKAVLWNLTNPRQPVMLGQPLAASDGAPVASVAFSPNGRVLAAGDGGGVIEQWSLPATTLPANIKFPLVAVASGASGLSGSTVAEGTGEGGGAGSDTGQGSSGAALWNVTGPGRLNQRIQPLTSSDKGAVYSVAFSPDGRTLAVGDDGGMVTGGETTLWNLADPRRPRRLTQPLAASDRGTVTSVAFSPDGRTLAVGDDGGASDGEVVLWNLANPQHPQELASPLIASDGGWVTSVAFSPDGRTLAIADSDDAVTLWSLTNLRRPQQLVQSLAPSGGGGVSSVAFSPDDRTLAVGGEVGGAGRVTLWNVTRPQHPQQFARPLATGDGGTVNSMAFSQDGRTLAVGDDAGEVALWDLTNLRQPLSVGQPLTAASGGVASTAFSRDGRTLATAESNGTLQVWNMNVDYAINRMSVNWRHVDASAMEPIHSLPEVPASVRGWTLKR